MRNIKLIYTSDFGDREVDALQLTANIVVDFIDGIEFNRYDDEIKSDRVHLSDSAANFFIETDDVAAVNLETFDTADLSNMTVAQFAEILLEKGRL